jgi:AcrR family transcriptional regulator
MGAATTPHRRPGGRNARVRKAILEATLKELAVTGYGRMSFEAIAARAGAHKTTLYRNWPTREALIKDALVARSEHVAPIPDTGSLREDLIRFGVSMIASITDPEYRAIIRAVASETDTGGALSVAARQFWEERLGQARSLIERGISRGELTADTDPTSMIEGLLGPLYLRLLITRQRLDRRFVERLVDQLLGPSSRDPA